MLFRSEHKKRVIVNNWSLWKDENTVIFSVEKQEEFRKMKDFIEEKIMRRQEGRAGQVTSPDVASLANSRFDQLRQIGELRASGILTEEEFEEQKRKILES